MFWLFCTTAHGSVSCGKIESDLYISIKKIFLVKKNPIKSNETRWFFLCRRLPNQNLHKNIDVAAIKNETSNENIHTPGDNFAILLVGLKCVSLFAKIVYKVSSRYHLQQYKRKCQKNFQHYMLKRNNFWAYAYKKFFLIFIRRIDA